MKPTSRLARCSLFAFGVCHLLGGPPQAWSQDTSKAPTTAKTQAPTATKPQAPTATSADSAKTTKTAASDSAQTWTKDQLDALVAPVALYPDPLLAQCLVASTYPLQVVKADRLLAANAGVSDEELAERIAEQEWDPSVMVLLSGFPTVIQRMAADIDWTERLGNAMLQQDDDVLAAVAGWKCRLLAATRVVKAARDAQLLDCLLRADRHAVSAHRADLGHRAALFRLVA